MGLQKKYKDKVKSNKIYLNLKTSLRAVFWTVCICFKLLYKTKGSFSLGILFLIYHASGHFELLQYISFATFGTTLWPTGAELLICTFRHLLECSVTTHSWVFLVCTFFTYARCACCTCMCTKKTILQYLLFATFGTTLWPPGAELLVCAFSACVLRAQVHLHK